MPQRNTTKRPGRRLNVIAAPVATDAVKRALRAVGDCGGHTTVRAIYKCAGVGLGVSDSIIYRWLSSETMAIGHLRNLSAASGVALHELTPELFVGYKKINPRKSPQTPTTRTPQHAKR